MAISINNDIMTLEIDGRVVATARFCQHAAADGRGARSSPATTAACSPRNQAVTALSIAERLAAGKGGDDPFVIAWREELPR
ncbi:MAG TPA: hypothetical protein VLW50_28040 [Streptosporangiaceae bacterium]|nr:hypothetical protein [Streptosporangiaceae bacterium]